MQCSDTQPASIVLTCAASALVSIAASTSPGQAAPFIFVFNEGDPGFYDLTNKKGPQKIDGKQINDPATGKPAWSYTLPAGTSTVNGDVLIKGGLVGQTPDGNDLLRFNGNVLYIYSEAGPIELSTGKEGGKIPLPPADTLTGTTLPANTPVVTLKEDTRDDANSGVAYSPAKGQPGFGKAAPDNNLFLFASDGNGGKSVTDNTPMQKSTSEGKSVTFSAASKTLSFANDKIIDTVFSGDSMVGATVQVPTLTLTGCQGFTCLFDALGADTFTVANGSQTYVSGHVASLSYDILSNTLSGVVGGLNFNAAAGSSWADRGADVFDPASANFDPNRFLTFSYTPDLNLFAQTGGFTGDAEIAGTDLLLAVVPEPAGLDVLAAGAAVVPLLRRRKRA